MPWLSLLVLAPLAGAVIIALLPAGRKMERWVALAASAVSLGVTLALGGRYLAAPVGFRFVERYTWIPALGVWYQVGIDGISLLLMGLTGLVAFTGVLVSWDLAERPREFFIFFLLMVSGVLGVFAARDIFLFFLFYELAVIPMYLLIGIWGSTQREYAALKLTLYLLLGSALLMVGFLALYLFPARPTTDLGALEGLRYPVDFQRRIFPFLFLGFAVLVPMWPFHTWSPDGHAAAPTAASMLHAGVLMKLGGYGLLRIPLALFPAAAALWAPVMATFGVINVLYGAMVATAQRDLKYIIGYSSVSHMGYVLLGLASLTPAGTAGAVLQMFTHGIMTALFFALIGFLYTRTHTRDLEELGGMAAQWPAVTAVFFLAALNSLGLPGLASFASEALVFFGTFPRFPGRTVLGILGVVVTAAYILYVAQKVFFGPPAFSEGAAESAGWVGAPTLPEKISFYLLAGALLYFGFFPAGLLRLIGRSLSGALPALVKGVGG